MADTHTLEGTTVLLAQVQVQAISLTAFKRKSCARAYALDVLHWHGVSKSGCVSVDHPFKRGCAMHGQQSGMAPICHGATVDHRPTREHGWQQGPGGD